MKQYYTDSINIYEVATKKLVPIWDANNHLTIEYQNFIDSGGVASTSFENSIDIQSIKFILDSNIQKILDYVAGSFGYSSMDRAVTYVNSTNLDWKEEAEALIAYRDSVWESVMTYIAIHGYPTQTLSLEQLQALLPPPPTPWLQKPV